MAEEDYVDRGFYSDGYYPDDPADGCEGWALVDGAAELGRGYCVDYEPYCEIEESEPVVTKTELRKKRKESSALLSQ